MSLNARRSSARIISLSVVLASRSLHDAGANGALIRVDDRRTIRALRRAFHHLLADTRCEVILQVTEDIAAGLRPTGHEPLPRDEVSTLALAFDRFGRGAFLLRPSAEVSREASAESTEQLRRDMRAELQGYLRGLSIGPIDEI